MHKEYCIDGFYNELLSCQDDAFPFIKRLEKMSLKSLQILQKAAELEHYNQGNTFNVYNNEGGTEKIFPFDVIPRIIAAAEWKALEAGLKQRIEALNLFIGDVYNEQKIFKDKIVPKELVISSGAYLKELNGFRPSQNVWIHITGSDLIRDETGKFYVLEDNLRCPSGVSYVLENRAVMKRIFPQAFQGMNVLPVSDYGDHLYDMLSYVKPSDEDAPQIVVLSPGPYNSAYFEHAYLASQMGVPLAQGSDLIVDDDEVFLRTTRGYRKVDVIYRRVDDTFLDPTFFRKDSLLGVPGLMQAYLRGKVTLANAPGTGIADDKAIYSYVPDIIKYYLGEDPLIDNVETYRCGEDKQKDFVISQLDNLVVKAVDQSGGYGMLIGPEADAKTKALFKDKILANPRHYIAQPVISLSQAPTLCDEGVAGRHVDLRPFVLYGKSIYVMPGGLTRVALQKGSLVVNSSQGGGSKDSWVLEEVDEKGGLLSA